MILTWVNSIQTMVARYCRARKGDMFFGTAAVVMAEFSKFLMSLWFLFIIDCNGNRQKFFDYLRETSDVIDTLKISIPAVLYVLLNNLYYIALSNLDAAVFQVMYQLKLFTTAILSVIILKKKLSRIQWFSLLLLFFGVILAPVQTPENKLNLTQLANSSVSLHTGSLKELNNARSLKESEEEIMKTKTDERKKNLLMGILAVATAAVVSAFSGVYFEKILKGFVMCF